MKKVFISLPMKGRTKDEIERTVKNIKEKVKGYLNETVDFINTIVQEKPPYESGEHTAVWYLGKALEIISTCDMVVVCGDIDYDKYNGCYIEKETAIRYGIPIMIVSGVL